MKPVPSTPYATSHEHASLTRSPLLASHLQLDLRSNEIGVEGASQLSAAVLANSKIEVFNEIPIKEMRADSLTRLDLNDAQIGDEGSMVVACLLPIMGSMTQLDLSYNCLGKESQAVLRKAVEGRSGFALVLKERDPMI